MLRGGTEVRNGRAAFRGAALSQTGLDDRCTRARAANLGQHV